MNISTKNPDEAGLLDYLKQLEKRISRIEAHLELAPAVTGTPAAASSPAARSEEAAEDDLELHIGQQWFSRIGILVLTVGMMLLLMLPYEGVPAVMPSLFGFVLTAVVMGLSYYWRTTFENLSRYMLGAGMVILFVAALRLHFWGSEAVIASRAAVVVLLLAVVALQLLTAVRRNSVSLSGLSLLMGYGVALISDQPYLLFTIITLMSAATAYLNIKYGWQNLIFLGIVLSYLSHFLWFLNNPLMGNALQLVEAPFGNIYFVLLYMAIFALGILYRHSSLTENAKTISSAFFACFGGYGLFLILTVLKFPAHLALSHVLASLLLLGAAMLFWKREKSRYATFFYAMSGYAALSVAIIARFESPEFFVWLSWQSIVVISTAIWFRSKFIIVANFFIFLMILLAYVIVAGKVSTVSIGLGVVALLSARILNWQKDRLELRTDFMRYAYLITAFFIFPYALYHSVPEAYVALSWIGVSVFYYLMSVWLKNNKYRWMALLNLILTVLYLFITGSSQLDPVLRVVSFLILGVVLLLISLAYNRMRIKRETKTPNPPESN